MNSRKKLLILLWLFFGIIVMLLVITWLINDSINNKDNNTNFTQKDYEYEFGLPINLEKDGGREEFFSNSAEHSSFGVIDDFYDDADIQYYDDKMQMQTYNGNKIISLSWMNEGNALFVEEPQFGSLEKFILTNGKGVSAVYKDVKLKDYKNYIKSLKDAGFNETINDKVKKNTNSYYCTVKNSNNVRVVVNFIDGKVYMEIIKS